MVRPKLVKPRGILHLRPDAPMPGYARFWPGDELAPCAAVQTMGGKFACGPVAA